MLKRFQRERIPAVISPNRAADHYYKNNRQECIVACMGKEYLYDEGDHTQHKYNPEPDDPTAVQHNCG